MNPIDQITVRSVAGHSSEVRISGMLSETCLLTLFSSNSMVSPNDTDSDEFVNSDGSVNSDISVICGYFADPFAHLKAHQMPQNARPIHAMMDTVIHQSS